MWQIGNVKIKNTLVLAPLAGISNAAYRSLAFKMGAGLVYSEMISDKALLYDNQKTKKMCVIREENHPVALQLFGSDPSSLTAAAQYLDKATSADIIDLNMGCPVNKVIKSGAGSALLLDEEKAVKIAQSIIAHIHKPLSVKLRLGYHQNEYSCFRLAVKLEKVGVKAIALHGRSKSALFSGPVDWAAIHQLKDLLTIPVIGNGDIKSLADFKAHEADADALMIGRAAIGNPFLLKTIADYLNGQDEETFTPFARLDYCLLHLQDLISLVGEETAIKQMRAIAPHYFSGLKDAAKYRLRLNTAHNYAEFAALIAEYRHSHP